MVKVFLLQVKIRGIRKLLEGVWCPAPVQDKNLRAEQEGQRWKRRDIVRGKSVRMGTQGWSRDWCLRPLRRPLLLEDGEATPQQGPLWSVLLAPRGPEFPRPPLIQGGPLRFSARPYDVKQVAGADASAGRSPHGGPRARLLVPPIRACAAAPWYTEVSPGGPTGCALQVSFRSCMFWHLNTVGMSLSAPIWLY